MASSAVIANYWVLILRIVDILSCTIAKILILLPYCQIINILKVSSTEE